jgi:RimJ/RimL family protein N-acetyltransferase
MFPRHLTTRDNQPLLIREAVGDDAADLLPFLEVIAGDTTFITFQPGEFSLTEEQEREFLEHSRQADNQLYLVAVVDNAIVGCITFSGGKYKRSRHTGLFGLSVLKSHWHLGIGSALLDSLIDWAKSGDVIHKIDLFVRTDNTRAIALYERKGFVREGTKRLDLIVDGVPHDSYLMGLIIDR